MIAIRLMTRAAAILLGEHCGEHSIANDVARSLHAHRGGRALAHVAVDGLAYRHREDYGEADDRDNDPMEWVRRIEVASRHATAMRPYLAS